MELEPRPREPRCREDLPRPGVGPPPYRALPRSAPRAGVLRDRPYGLRPGPSACVDGVRCEVIAPSMIPKAPGDKVKTDKRDCRRLARLHRAGELVAIRIPTPTRRRCGTCAGRGATWSRTSPGPATASPSSCCATPGCGVAARTGRSNTRHDWRRRGSRSRRWPPPSVTTGRWS